MATTLPQPHTHITRVLGYARRLPANVTGRIAKPWMSSLCSVQTAEKVAALTFDDGPHPVYTPRLLDVLAKHNAKATFFIVGKAAEAYPEVMKRLAAEGHALANHTWDHRSVPLLTQRERVEQMNRCSAALKPYGGDNKLFRPPFGNQSWASRLDALRLGYEVVAWSHHALDWLEYDAAFVQSRLAEQLRPGSIFLLHDALYRAEPERLDRTPSITAVDALLSESDYRFVTVPELLKTGKARKKMWFKKPDKAWVRRAGMVEGGEL